MVRRCSNTLVRISSPDDDGEFEPGEEGAFSGEADFGFEKINAGTLVSGLRRYNRPHPKVVPTNTNNDYECLQCAFSNLS